MMFYGRSFLFAALGCGLVFVPAAHFGLNSLGILPGQSVRTPIQDDEADPLKRQRSDEDVRKAQKAVRQELKGAYKSWLEQDVPYIISDEERKAFKHLSNDEEREAFIEQFWLRRNPNPDSSDNEFREEHYRRIQYANDHYAAGKPGWKTDRGHVYISFGEPDRIESHPSGGAYQRPTTREAARPLPSRLKSGIIATLRAWATTSIWSLWIPACAATTTLRSTAAKRMRWRRFLEWV